MTPPDLDALAAAELRRREVPPIRPDWRLIVCRHCGRRMYSDDGRPITVSDPGSPHAQLFREIAAKVWTKVSGEGARRAPPRIVVE